MTSQGVFLDESATNAKWHRILSVGGFSADLEHLGEIEEAWRDAKAQLGLAGHDLHYSSRWPGGPEQRLTLIEDVIPTLPLKHGIVALLEDFRPKRMKLTDKDKRSDFYVHRDCFTYILQRLCAPQYAPSGSGAHVISFDHGDHFPKLDGQYRLVHGDPWALPWGGQWPSLRQVGYSESLLASGGGSLNEIADLVVGATTRWAACRCGVARGKQIPEQQELDRACRALLPLFPYKLAIPRRWTGYSFVVHTRGLTGKEQLKDSLDGWLNALSDT